MKIKIREDITPENAKSLGLIWIQDVIYDEEASPKAMEDIVRMVKSGKYELGLCASIGYVSNMYGLYKKEGA